MSTVHSPSYCILLPQRAFRDKYGGDIIYFSQRHELLNFNFTFTGFCGAFAKWSDTFETKAYFLDVSVG